MLHYIPIAGPQGAFLIPSLFHPHLIIPIFIRLCPPFILVPKGSVLSKRTLIHLIVVVLSKVDRRSIYYISPSHINFFDRGYIALSMANENCPLGVCVTERGNVHILSNFENATFFYGYFQV